MTGPSDKSFEGMLRQIRRDIVELQRRLGRSLTPVPDPLPPAWQGYGPDSATVAAATAWETIDATNLVYTITPDDDLDVIVTFSAHIIGNGAVYGMIGARATGGVVLDPERDQATNTLRYALTAFNSGTAGVTVTGTKRLTLPAGVATNIVMQRRRSANTFAAIVNYPTMVVTPHRWV